MNERQRELLELLDGLIEECKECPLHVNGKALPYWTPNSRFLIIGEAPGKNEVENGEPFVGRAGKNLWEAMAKHGFRREDFGIINRVQCRPVVDNKNGKPTVTQMSTCQKWVRKFIKCLDPKVVILLGNYAKSIVDNKNGGIENMNGKTLLMAEELSGKTYGLVCVCSVHPAVCIYEGQAGVEKLEKAIKRFSVVAKE
jgi:DNA polymerase